MSESSQPNAAIQTLLREVEKRFGANAFIAQPSSIPFVIGFRSATSKHSYFSVVTSEVPEGKFSLQVTLEGKEFEVPVFSEDGKQFSLPCDTAFDGVVGIAELLDVFEAYRNA